MTKPLKHIERRQENEAGILYRPSRILDRTIFIDRYCRGYRIDDVTGGPVSSDHASGCEDQCLLSGSQCLTVSQAVATPIEQELNGTPGMIYMQSSSTNSGGLTITVTFDVSADADLAAVEIQNRVKLAESRLPSDVVQNGITVEKQSASQLMTLSLSSDDPRFV